MKLRLRSWLLPALLLAPLAFAGDARAEDAAEVTPIQVTSLEGGVSVAGQWHFTREDDPANAAPESSTEGWVSLSTPGPWSNAYPGSEPFRVGWYRREVHFDPSLVGTEVDLLVDTYMASLDVYVDGERVYHRGEANIYESYYAIRAVPVSFTVERPVHVVAIRVDTPLMVGVYQLPFELRAHGDHSAALIAYESFNGDFRVLLGSVIFFFGLFFLFLSWRVKQRAYLVAGLACVALFPFLVGTSDTFAAFMDPEILLLLIYPAIATQGTLNHLFMQSVAGRPMPRFNRVLITFAVVLFLVDVSQIFFFHHSLFLVARKITFLSGLVLGAHATWLGVKAARQGRRGALILAFGTFAYIAAAAHDTLIALGKIHSTGLVLTGTLCVTGAMIAIAVDRFANTFLENAKLLGDVQQMNENLEGLVEERTAELHARQKDMAEILANVPEAIVAIVPGLTLHEEHSACAPEILGVEDVPGASVMVAVFGGAELDDDRVDQVKGALLAIVGEDSVNHLINEHLLPEEVCRLRPDGTRQYLELSWAPIEDANEIVNKMLLSVRDVTELRELRGAAEARTKELAAIGELIAVGPEVAPRLLSDGRCLVDRAKATTLDDAEAVRELKRFAHTLKGEARTYGLGALAAGVHNLETACTAGDDAPEEVRLATAALADEVALLTDVWTEKLGHDASEDARRTQDAERIQRALSLLSESANDSRAVLEIQQAARAELQLVGRAPLAELLEDEIGAARRLATERGKEPPSITFSGEEVLLDRNAEGRELVRALGHVLRNAVDHGLEAAEDRLARGKPAAGAVRVTVGRDGGHVIVRVADDGRGLDLAQLARKAGLEDDAPEQEIARCVFRSGLSTAGQVDLVSGRGVGMDAVARMMTGLGGAADVELGPIDEATGRRAFTLRLSMLDPSFEQRATA